MPDIDTTISYYVGRLIYQYQQPNAQRTIAILVKQLLADNLAWQLQDAFNIPTAVGPQLDILGKYVGIPRNIGDPTPLPFFGFVRYSGVGSNQHGFTRYAGGSNADAVFYRYGYNQANATALSDTAYLFMLLFKIALNSCDQTLAAVQIMLQTLTSGNVHLVDNKDMTITYQVGPGIPVSAQTLTPYLPKPMGVGITVLTVAALITGTGDTVVTGTGDTVVVGNL
jgi:hypothetical protein